MGGFSQSPKPQPCRTWPLLKVLLNCRVCQPLAGHLAHSRLLLDSFGFQQQRPETYQLAPGSSALQPSQPPTLDTELRVYAGQGENQGPLHHTLPEGRLGTPSALSTCQAVQWQRVGLPFTPRPQPLWHSCLPRNREFSLIPIIRVPGQTNSLIQMSPGPQSHSLWGFSLYC